MEFNDLNEEMFEDRNIVISNLNNSPLQIGDMAPLFSANSTQGNIKLSDFAGKWLILFSHPGDFTPAHYRLKGENQKFLPFISLIVFTTAKL